MKNIYTLIFLLLLTVSVKAQNCKPTFAIGAPNTVSFMPPVGFPSPQYTFNWDFGDGSSINAFAPTHVYNQAGPVTVVLTVYNTSDGTIVCVDSSVISLNFCNPSFQQDTIDPSTFYFNSNITGSTTAFWQFGDGQTATGNNVTHTFILPGIYAVSMQELDLNGAIICSSIIMVSSNTSANCSFVALQPNPSSNPALYDFTALTSSSSAIVSWDFSDGTPPVNGINVQKLFGLPGVYNICMTVIDGIDTCVSCQLLNVVTQQGFCTYNYIQNTGSYLDFDFSAISNNSGSIYSWDFGDGNFGTGASINHTFSSSGTYIVCLTETDSVTGVQVCNYCTTIAVIPPPPNCNFTYALQSGVTNGVSFTAPLFVGTTYVWDFGDGTTDSTITAFTQHQYQVAAVYVVTLQTYFNGALVCTSTVIVDLTQQNQFCQANFTSVSLGLQTFFIDQSVAIPLNVPPVQPPVYYSWNFGDGNTSALQFPQHIYSQPGTYTVCLTVTTVGCTTTYCSPLTVDTTIITPISCNAFFIFTQLTPYNMFAVNLSNGVNLNFSWDFGDGSPVSNQPYPTHQYASTGTYALCLTVSDNSGCTDTYCDSLTVDSAGNILYRATVAGFMLNVVSPADLTTSLKENEKLITELYPVPATEKLYIKMNDVVKGNVTYEVYNAEGRSVLNGPLSKGKTELNISELRAGIYLLRLSGDLNTESRTFIKQ